MQNHTKHRTAPARRWLKAAIPGPLPLLAAAAIAGIILLICLLGARQARDKIAIVKPLQFIGHADEASYALQGRSIAAGHGINVNYVSTFFIPYPPGITHREDHWPPFMGYSIAPFFYFMGESAWVARLPEILYGSVGLPLATALLAYALSRRGYVALAAGMLIMVNPDLYLHSMRTLSDVANAMLLTGFCGCVLMSVRRPWFHVGAGVFLACAYFAKGSEIVLLGFYPLLVILCGGFAAVLRRQFYFGMAAALLLMAPYWVGNWRAYGNPLHSTQNYVAAFYGFGDWETEFYKPYWGKDLPKLADRWEKHPDYWQFTRSQIPLVARTVLNGGFDRRTKNIDLPPITNDFGDIGLKFRMFLRKNRVVTGPQKPYGSKTPATLLPMKPIAKWQAPVSEITTLAALALLALAVLAVPVWLVASAVRWLKSVRRKKTEVVAIAATRLPIRLVGPVLGVGLVVVSQLAFVVLFWCFDVRLCFPVLPLVMALGCTAIACFVQWPVVMVVKAAGFLFCRWRKSQSLPRWIAVTLSWRRWVRPAFTVSLCVVGLLMVGRIESAERQLLKSAGVTNTLPFDLRGSSSVTMGRWLKLHLPTAVVMCRDPWELLFSAGPQDKAVGLPNPVNKGKVGAEQIFAIAHYYHVQYFFEDAYRPSLGPYLSRTPRIPGLKRVPGSPWGLYELDWKVLPTRTVEDFWGGK